MKKLALFIVLVLSTCIFAQSANQVGTIQKIDLKAESDRFSIFISGNGKLEPNTIVIDNPPRIALDFVNVTNTIYPRVIQAESNSYIHRIRTSLYAKGRETISRVVVDLKSRSDYSLFRTEDGVVLSVSPVDKPMASKTVPPSETTTPPSSDSESEPMKPAASPTENSSAPIDPPASATDNPSTTDTPASTSNENTAADPDPAPSSTENTSTAEVPPSSSTGNSASTVPPLSSTGTSSAASVPPPSSTANPSVTTVPPPSSTANPSVTTVPPSSSTGSSSPASVPPQSSNVNPPPSTSEAPPIQNPAPAATAVKPEATVPPTSAPAVNPQITQPQADTPPASTVPVQSGAPQDIVIGSEDLIEVSVFELPQFNTTTRVQGDGTITMPLVGSIEVRGLKKKEVEAKIALALQAKYVNNANVSVNVKEYKSRQVSLLGEVRSPGAYYIMSQRTLLQLLSEAGGLSSQAGPKCYVFRLGSPKIEINLRDLMVNGNPELNIPIYPGDVVNVPTDVKVVIYVLGSVKTPGAVSLSTSMPVTLLAAIAAAGGPTDTAKQSEIRVKRKNSIGEENTIKVNLKDIMKGKIEDVPLFEGDVVTVPESFF